MDDKITLDAQTLKALVGENRIAILKLLGEKRYTQSELADILKKAKPSIKEHLDILEKSGLVKKEETKRKWKYYSLTFKGKMVVKPREVKVLIALIINSLAFLGTGYVVLKKFLSSSVASSSLQAKAAPQAAALYAEESAAVADLALRSAPMPEATILATAEPTIQLGWIVALVILGLTAALMTGYLMSKRQVIIIESEKNETKI